MYIYNTHMRLWAKQVDAGWSLYAVYTMCVHICTCECASDSIDHISNVKALRTSMKNGLNASSRMLNASSRMCWLEGHA